MARFVRKNKLRSLDIRSMGQVCWIERMEERDRREHREKTRGWTRARECVHTRSGCRLCCRRRRCRSSLPTQLLDALRQPPRHDLSAFSTTTCLSLFAAHSLSSFSRTRSPLPAAAAAAAAAPCCFSPSSFLHSLKPHRAHTHAHTLTRLFLAWE